MTLFDLISIVFSAMLVMIALLSVLTKNTVKSMILLSVLSMLSVVVFVLLKAPDVAITEAVVGSGMTTAFFMFTLIGLKNKEAKK